MVAASFKSMLQSYGVKTHEWIVGNQVESCHADAQLAILLCMEPATLLNILTSWQEKQMRIVAVAPHTYLRPELASELIEAGASGVLDGTETLEIAIAVIHLISVGGIFPPRKSVGTICYNINEPRSVNEPLNVNGMVQLPSTVTAHNEDIAFTSREREVLEQLRTGAQNKIIAYELGISENTVKVHVHNVMRKLQARNRTQVVAMLKGRAAIAVGPPFIAAYDTLYPSERYNGLERGRAFGGIISKEHADDAGEHDR